MMNIAADYIIKNMNAVQVKQRYPLMTTLAFTEPLQDTPAAHGGTFNTPDQVNKLVSFLLQSDFLNTIYQLAPALDLFLSLECPRLENFEHHYQHKGYKIDYSLLKPELQQRINSIDQAIAKINDILNELRAQEVLAPRTQLQQLFLQCEHIVRTCWQDFPSEKRITILRQLLRFFQKAYEEYCEPS